MGDTDQRQIMRDSLFVMAGLRLTGKDTEYRVKIRNLSAGGLMAEGDFRVTRGVPISIEIRNLGWVDGVVAWVQDNRFGIAFDEEIDPKAARGPGAPPSESSDYYSRRAGLDAMRFRAADPSQIRKI